MAKKQWNLLIGSTVFTLISIVAVSYLAIYPFLMSRLVGAYRNETRDIYCVWYDVYIEEPQQLIFFQKPNVREWGITARYKYENSADVISAKYDKLLEKHGWCMQSHVARESVYGKGDLIFKLKEIDKNTWEINISVEGYHDKGILEKLINGNTKNHSG